MPQVVEFALGRWAKFHDAVSVLGGVKMAFSFFFKCGFK